MSTLFVNNLNTASGTTITVPTGKKVVVTDQGGITAPGAVVNTAQVQLATGASTTSTSDVALVTAGTYTTTIANSKILVAVNIQTQVGTNNDSSGLGVFNLRHSLDSYSAALCRLAVARYRNASGENGWIQGGIPFVALHSANQAAGTAITYKIYGRKQSGNAGVYVNDQWGMSSFGNVIFQEIAP